MCRLDQMGAKRQRLVKKSVSELASGGYRVQFQLSAVNLTRTSFQRRMARTYAETLNTSILTSQKVQRKRQLCQIQTTKNSFHLPSYRSPTSHYALSFHTSRKSSTSTRQPSRQRLFECSRSRKKTTHQATIVPTRKSKRLADKKSDCPAVQSPNLCPMTPIAEENPPADIQAIQDEEPTLVADASGRADQPTN